MTSMGGGESARKLADYYAAWLDNLADDVILEGSAMDGFVQGAEAVRTVLVSIRALYDYQEFNSVGPYGENGRRPVRAGVLAEAGAGVSAGSAVPHRAQERLDNRGTGRGCHPGRDAAAAELLLLVSGRGPR